MQLIYFVCYGQSQINLLRISVDSLRRAAQFKDHILVFADSKFSVPGADHIEIVSPVANWTGQSIGRIVHGLQIQGDYDDIAYLDNDVLAIRPLDKFFDETTYFRAMEEESVWMGSHHSTCGALTAEEKNMALNRRPIISGAIVASSKIFKECLMAWKRAFDSAPEHHFREQSALNAAVIRGWLPFKGFNYDVIVPASGARDLNRKACLLHFWAKNKKRMPTTWLDWIKRHPECAPQIYTDTAYPFRILSSTVSYGELGLRGNLGYEGLWVSPPPHLQEWHFISAHAQSRMHIRIEKPMRVVGFLNGSARSEPRNSAIFSIDKSMIGSATGPRDFTPEQMICPGEHVLDVESRKSISYRHSVWAISEASSDEIRL